MGESQATIGIIYVATGKKYIEMAKRSARSVRKYNPDLNIHLFGDWKKQGYNFERSSDPFTSVSNIDDAHSRSKVDYMGKTPYDRTLYLDTDTRVAVDITSLFALLDRFDVGLAHAHLRRSRLQEWKVKIPESFPQFNSGVLLFKKTPDVLNMMSNWNREFYLAKTKDDQLILRELLWITNLRVATLPPEYNIRFLKYPVIWNKREAKPKIFHLHMYQRGNLWFLDSIFMFPKNIYREIISIKKTLKDRFRH